MIKTGGGYQDIDEENKRHKDLYISKLDTLIKQELGTIWTMWKRKENLEVETADFKMMIEENWEEIYILGNKVWESRTDWDEILKENKLWKSEHEQVWSQL